MDIASLKAFLAVAETGSFSAAAAQLFLTQPAVSKRVAALERELKTPLFDRIGHRITLTEAGRALLLKARLILNEIEESRRVVANLSGVIGGPLQLATSHHIGLHRLPPVLRDFSRRYPDVGLDIRFMESEAACTAVAAGELELAVVTLPESAASPLLLLPVWDDPMHIAAGAEHPLAKTQLSGLAALAEYPAILPEADTFTRQIIEQKFREQNLRLKIALETNYLETIRMMVAIGLGWSVLPETLFDGELIRLDTAGFSLQRSLGVVRHRDKTLSNAGNAFIECALAFAAPQNHRLPRVDRPVRPGRPVRSSRRPG
ncbi:MAG TPA: LysR family transcriptional regulator [Gammaproteobacteria bacterium]|nr:LysR family transcriptional regulator [Gammaproteobacteria bacterium]